MRQQTVRPSLKPPTPVLRSPAPLLKGTDTHQHAGFHAAFVWKLIPPEGHDSDSDSVARLVAGPVRLNEAGDVPGAEGEGGGVGENQAVPSVAPHRQPERAALC